MHRARFAWSLCACAALAACSKRSGEKAAENPNLPAAIAVGATLPFGGKEGHVARYLLEGYELAFDNANRRGGIALGKAKVPVKLRVLDDGGNIANAAPLIRRLVEEDRVDFLLGTYNVDLVEEQSTVAEQNRVPYVAGAGSAAALFQRHYRYLFSVQSPIELLAYSEMRWIDEQQKAGRLPNPAKIALVWEKTLHGQEYRKGVFDFAEKTASRRASYSIALDAPFEPGRRDLRPLLREVKAAKADLFLADVAYGDFIALHREYVAAGLCHAVLSYGAHGTEVEAQEPLGLANLSHIVSAVWWDARLGGKGSTHDFVESFRGSHHRDPEWYQALAYEAVRALFAAIEQAGKVDREEVRNRLASMNLESILPGGRLSFGSDQQAHYPFVVLQNTPEGKSAIIYPNDLAETPGVAPNPKCKR